MLVRYKLGIFLILVLGYSQNNNNDCIDLRKGTFEIYENDKMIGHIYRKDDYQIEKYLEDNQYTIATTRFNDCLLTLKAHEVNDALDTITWSISYKKTEKNQYYTFIAKPKYLKINYTYEGKIRKIDDKIKNIEILKLFDKLSR